MGQRLTYQELERRISAIPDGPASVLNAPAWVRRLDIVGGFGIVLGLSPILLIKLLTPQEWMLWLARAGLMLALCLVPGILRNVLVLARGFIHWKPELVGQLDHDLAEFRSLTTWLSGFPLSEVKAHLRFVQAGQARMAAKLGLIAGGIDKLGVLPLLVALAVQLRAISSLAAVAALPTWQIVVALFAGITYLIALMGSLMRLRMQLYETVLAEAVAARTAPDLSV